MKKTAGVKELTFQFALNVISITTTIKQEEKEFVITKQLLKSGTAIGALVREAEFAQSRADFINKMSIALKEANETIYWLELLTMSFIKYKHKCEELIITATSLLRILVTIVKKAKENLSQKKL